MKASFDNIVKVEYNRKKEDHNKIYLFKNNQGFWRAYEWSCFLMHNFNKELTDDDKLKISLTQSNKAHDKMFISCGCKSSSFKKFLPELIEIINEGDLKVFEIFDNEYDYSKMDDYFKEFKTEEALKSKQKQISNQQSSNNVSMFSVIKKIMGYNLYNRNQEELTDFVSSLKNDCATIIAG